MPLGFDSGGSSSTSICNGASLGGSGLVETSQSRSSPAGALAVVVVRTTGTGGAVPTNVGFLEVETVSGALARAGADCSGAGAGGAPLVILTTGAVVTPGPEAGRELGSG